MSGAIRIEASTVTAVLLDDGWHEVHSRSFRVGPYRLAADVSDVPEFYKRVLGETADHEPGFTFKDPGGHTFAGPLTSILAIRS